jgi:hypothetical protein
MPKEKHEKLRQKREQDLLRQESKSIPLPTPSNDPLKRAKAIANAHALQGMIKAEDLSEIFSSQNKPLLIETTKKEAAIVIQRRWRSFNSNNWLHLMRASDKEISLSMLKDLELKLAAQRSLFSTQGQQQVDTRSRRSSSAKSSEIFRDEASLELRLERWKMEMQKDKDRKEYAARKIMGRPINKSASESNLSSAKKRSQDSQHSIRINTPKTMHTSVVSTTVSRIDTWKVKGLSVNT